jgi:hypothetical protein
LVNPEITMGVDDKYSSNIYAQSIILCVLYVYRTKKIFLRIYERQIHQLFQVVSVSASLNSPKVDDIA